MTTDELLTKLPSHIGRNEFHGFYISDNKRGEDMGWLYLHNDGKDWCASYGYEGNFVCLNPDAEKPPYNNAVCYGKTPNEALQGLYDWCVKNGFINEWVMKQEDLIPKFGEYNDNEPLDMGEVSDGYHTFNELYEYRMLYNAALFNEFAKQGLYDVHKSRKHSDGEYPFDDSNWFIVMAELPTGQISNHYEMKDWDKFQIPEKPLANKWDEHSPRDVTDRLTSFTTPKKEYPKTYEECCDILQLEHTFELNDLTIEEETLFKSFIQLKRCRDAYWKIAGEEMGLGKPWEPRWNDGHQKKYCIYNGRDDIQEDVWLFANFILAFPTEEMRDAFYENFKELIEQCKELL